MLHLKSSTEPLMSESEAMAKIEELEKLSFERGQKAGFAAGIDARAKAVAALAENPGLGVTPVAAVSVSASGAPARADEEESYRLGRRDAAHTRNYARGVADEETSGNPKMSDQHTAGGRHGVGSVDTKNRSIEQVDAAAERAEIEAASKSEWDKSSGLRSEFSSLAAYMAWRVADATGRVKISTPRVLRGERSGATR